jgi:hypothetical protein
MATITLILVAVYSFNSYVEAYVAIRMLRVTVSEFNIKEVNATYAKIETILTLTNPSTLEFYVLGVEQNMYLNGKFFMYLRPYEPSEYRPMKILPNSSVNITITKELPPMKIELLHENTAKNWLASFRILLEGPVIGRFWKSIVGSIDSLGGMT